MHRRDALITVVVGHRGTGKTALLGRIQSHVPTVETADLDQLIEAEEGETISEIFRTRGEAVFRSLEQRELERFVQRHKDRDAFVAVGAGFTGPLPGDVHCLWVRRDTDPFGRIFLDRPRLDKDLDPLEEYLARFADREARYRTWADEVLTLGEGFEEVDEPEADFFRDRISDLGGMLTILPENLSPPARWKAWIQRRHTWGLSAFEVRDDLLTPEEIRIVLDTVPPEDLLYSFRNPGAPRPDKWPEEMRTDRAMELGPCPHQAPHIVSLHERRAGAPLSDAIDHLENARSHLKLAVEVHTFQELLEGHEWAARDPGNRSFLPRSSDGRWAWFRLLTWHRTRVTFLREGGGSAPDQPTLMDRLRFGSCTGAFAAVLGDPVAHSRTPAEQRPFFAARGMPVVAVRITEADVEAGALEVLRELGLAAAAVTAPLKILAHSTCASVTPEADRLASVNTLCLDESTWHGHNTDREGLEGALKAAAPSPPIAVWGGGGTRAMLGELFPHAMFYSARTGHRTRGPDLIRPRTVVWATGRPGADPPADWRPGTVLDLDYRDSAPGRTFALRTGARYVSGLDMFRRQAEGQRRWWESRMKQV